MRVRAEMRTQSVPHAQVSANWLSRRRLAHNIARPNRRLHAEPFCYTIRRMRPLVRNNRYPRFRGAPEHSQNEREVTPLAHCYLRELYRQRQKGA
jgi:hypothetical protein